MGHDKRGSDTPKAAATKRKKATEVATQPAIADEQAVPAAPQPKKRRRRGKPKLKLVASNPNPIRQPQTLLEVRESDQQLVRSGENLLEIGEQPLTYGNDYDHPDRDDFIPDYPED